MSDAKDNGRVLLRVSFPEGRSGQLANLDLLQAVINMLTELKGQSGDRHIQHGEYYGGVSFDLVSTATWAEEAK